MGSSAASTGAMQPEARQRRVEAASKRSRPVGRAGRAGRVIRDTTATGVPPRKRAVRRKERPRRHERCNVSGYVRGRKRTIKWLKAPAGEFDFLTFDEDDRLIAGAEAEWCAMISRAAHRSPPRRAHRPSLDRRRSGRRTLDHSPGRFGRSDRYAEERPDAHAARRGRAAFTTGAWCGCATTRYAAGKSFCG